MHAHDHVVLLSFARNIEALFPGLRKTGLELLSQTDLRWH
jgi:hypothetical protein